MDEDAWSGGTPLLGVQVAGRGLSRDAATPLLFLALGVVLAAVVLGWGWLELPTGPTFQAQASVGGPTGFAAAIFLAIVLLAMMPVCAGISVSTLRQAGHPMTTRQAPQEPVREPVAAGPDRWWHTGRGLAGLTAAGVALGVAVAWGAVFFADARAGRVASSGATSAVDSYGLGLVVLGVAVAA